MSYGKETLTTLRQPAPDLYSIRGTRAAMCDYRFYFVDNDGYIVGPPFVADLASDEAAKEHATADFKRFDIEIWTGTRCVGLVRRELLPASGTRGG